MNFVLSITVILSCATVNRNLVMLRQSGTAYVYYRLTRWRAETALDWLTSDVASSQIQQQSMALGPFYSNHIHCRISRWRLFNLFFQRLFTIYYNIIVNIVCGGSRIDWRGKRWVGGVQTRRVRPPPKIVIKLNLETLGWRQFIKVFLINVFKILHAVNHFILIQ